MSKKSIKDVNINNKRIFLRVDYNVPLLNGEIEDDFRIDSTYPTIEYLIQNNAKSIVIGSHLGRPKGKYIKEMSLMPVYNKLKEWFKQQNLHLEFSNVYDESISGNSYTFLENLRFIPEEEDINNKNSSKYTSFFQKIADLTVNDAFGVVHHNSGSLTRTGLPVVAGLLLKKELDIINNLFCVYKPLKKPIDLLILGGKKVKGKIGLLKKIIPKCETVFITGGMSNSFLKTKNVEIGKSFCEDSLFSEINNIYELGTSYKTEILLPVDFITTKTVKSGVYEQKDVMDLDDIQVDIGKKTIEKIKDLVPNKGVVFWNGPPGIFEDSGADFGTKRIVEILNAAYDSTKIIVGGGDTASAVTKFGDRKKMFHVSTGGGSLIALLDGDTLPGIDIIEEK